MQLNFFFKELVPAEWRQSIDRPKRVIKLKDVLKLTFRWRRQIRSAMISFKIKDRMTRKIDGFSKSLKRGANLQQKKVYDFKSII